MNTLPGPAGTFSIPGTDKPNIVNLGSFDKRDEEAEKRKHIFIPRHIKPNDWSGEACLNRFDLWMSLRMTYGPKGFRQTPSSKHHLGKRKGKDGKPYWETLDRFSLITKKASLFLEEQKKQSVASGNLSFDTSVKTIPELEKEMNEEINVGT